MRELVMGLSAEERLLRRLETARPAADAVSVVERLLGRLHEPERRLVTDARRFATAVCSRRAGKTEAVATALVRAVVTKPGSCALYLTRSRRDSRRILWQRLKDLVRDLGVGAEPNETEMSVGFPSGSRIYLEGVNDRGKVEDYRGVAFSLVVLDEAQNFPSYIRELIDGTIAPALQDYNGEVRVVGTPGPIPSGYYYEVAQSSGWGHHAWTAWDNPSLEQKSGKTARQQLDEELARRGVGEDDPSIQREWFGRWVTDSSSLVWRLETAQTFDVLAPGPWRHVIAIDVGFEDADAIVGLAFRAEDAAAYVVEEWVGRRQLISDLARRVAETRDRLGQVVGIVMDEGGLGKKIGEELRQRYSLGIKAAEKTQKAGFIELVNDAARTGRLKFRRGSPSVEDARKVEWDRERSTPDRRVISDRFHSDVLDALTYGFRESRHWMHVERPAPASPGSAEWCAREEAGMFRAAERRAERVRRDRSRAWA